MKGIVTRARGEMLADYWEQLCKQFEQEARLKELSAKQAQLNAALDLDKCARQVAPDAVSDDAPREAIPGPADIGDVENVPCVPKSAGPSTEPEMCCAIEFDRRDTKPATVRSKCPLLQCSPAMRRFGSRFVIRSAEMNLTCPVL